MTDFAEKFSSLLSLEMAGGTIQDPEAMAKIIECLASGLALAAAMAAAGNPDRLSHLLEGTTSFIFETATERAPFARMVANAMEARR